MPGRWRHEDRAGLLRETPRTAPSQTDGALQRAAFAACRAPRTRPLMYGLSASLPLAVSPRSVLLKSRVSSVPSETTTRFVRIRHASLTIGHTFFPTSKDTCRPKRPNRWRCPPATCFFVVGSRIWCMSIRETSPGSRWNSSMVNCTTSRSRAGCCSGDSGRGARPGRRPRPRTFDTLMIFGKAPGATMGDGYRTDAT